MQTNSEQANSLFKDYTFNNNPTGRMITENTFGNWSNVNDQFNSGKKLNKELTGSLFPNEKGNQMGNPQDRVVFGYSRIGYDFKSR